MYTFIVNPNARSGLGASVWHQLEEILKEKNVNYQVFFTRYQRHATSIVHELTSDLKKHIIVILGGDGTVNEVVNGIADYSKTTLGYIPIGSSNDFARYFKLNRDPSKALQVVLSPSRFQNMNIGTICYSNNNRRKHFAVSAGIGFDAAVCHQAVVSKLKILLNKLHLGKLTYAGIALHQMLALSPKDMTITLDDQKPMTFHHVYFTSALNHPFQGGGFKFCPKADPCDDYLDVTVISDISKLKVLLLLPTAFKGWHVHFKGVHIFRCKKLKIESSIPLPVHTDGEPVFLQREMTASLEPDKVRVITG